MASFPTDGQVAAFAWHNGGDPDPGAPSPREGRTNGGCLPMTGLLLLVILIALIATAWLRSRHETPDPAMSGRPPQIPAR